MSLLFARARRLRFNPLPAPICSSRSLPPVNFPISLAPASFDHFEMKSSKPKEWTEAERKRLACLARRRVVSEIAAALGRHAGSVRRMARSMGLILKK